jgi:hypothetical protein
VETRQEALSCLAPAESDGLVDLLIRVRANLSGHGPAAQERLLQAAEAK